jgi:hypothetical protein
MAGCSSRRSSSSPGRLPEKLAAQWHADGLIAVGHVRVKWARGNA